MTLILIYHSYVPEGFTALIIPNRPPPVNNSAKPDESRPFHGTSTYPPASKSTGSLSGEWGNSGFFADFLETCLQLLSQQGILGARFQSLYCEPLYRLPVKTTSTFLKHV